MGSDRPKRSTRNKGSPRNRSLKIRSLFEEMKMQQLVEKLAEASAEVAEELAERKVLYAKDPNCAKCQKPIEDINDAFIVRRANGEHVLIHWVDICFSREVQDMLDRYLDERKSRVVWTEKAAS